MLYVTAAALPGSVGLFVLHETSDVLYFTSQHRLSVRRRKEMSKLASVLTRPLFGELGAGCGDPSFRRPGLDWQSNLQPCRNRGRPGAESSAGLRRSWSGDSGAQTRCWESGGSAAVPAR